MVTSTNDNNNKLASDPVYQKALAAAAKMESCLASGKIVEDATAKLVSAYPEVAQGMIDDARATEKPTGHGYSINDVTVQNLPKVTAGIIVGDCLNSPRR